MTLAVHHDLTVMCILLRLCWSTAQQHSISIKSMAQSRRIRANDYCAHSSTERERHGNCEVAPRSRPNNVLQVGTFWVHTCGRHVERPAACAHYCGRSEYSAILASAIGKLGGPPHADASDRFVGVNCRCVRPN